MVPDERSTSADDQNELGPWAEAIKRCLANHVYWRARVHQTLYFTPPKRVFSPRAVVYSTDFSRATPDRVEIPLSFLSLNNADIRRILLLTSICSSSSASSSDRFVPEHLGCHGFSFELARCHH